MNDLDIAHFEKRKQDHIDLALQPQHQSQSSDSNKIVLIHEALPDLDFHSIDISTHSLGMSLHSPFFVSSMTAGHQHSLNINQRLAEACSQTYWPMGVGSQRRELSDPEAMQEWKTIRSQFPQVNFFGNLGIAQLITTNVDAIQRLCENIHAAGLFIHCNPLQECIQAEGTPEFAGSYDALEKICAALTIPVIVKETGCGFSANTLSRLNNIGIAAVDVSGFGGTHWGRIEGSRTTNPIQARTAQHFNNWGISTLESILNAHEIKPCFEIWASGGIRSGLDAAKYLALNAARIGVAKPMLEAALVSAEKVIEVMQCFEYELKTALFCTGSATINVLRETHRWQLKY